MGVWLEQGLSRRGVLESLPLESPVWEPASRLLKPPGEIKNAVISGGATAGADGWRREQQADQEGRVEEKRVFLTGQKEKCSGFGLMMLVLW